MEIKNITEEEFYEASNRVQNHIDKNAVLMALCMKPMERY